MASGDDHDAGKIEGQRPPFVVVADPPEGSTKTCGINWTKRRMCFLIAVLAVLLTLAVIVIIVGLVLFIDNPPDLLPRRFYSPNYLRYVLYSKSGSKTNGTLSKRQLYFQSGACGTQNFRDESDPLYYTTGMGIPMLPFSTGFMSTHSSMRFLTVQEQVAVFIGERKHGFWRIQENGFVRVYRKEGSTDGITVEEKQAALDIDDCSADVQTDWHGNLDKLRLLGVLVNNYLHQDTMKSDFGYAFGDEIHEHNSTVQWLNWIDLPIYHAMFNGKYEDHVPIDLPMFFCQQSSAGLPHVGITWDLIKAQPAANKIGPLGKRAGLDIQENFNAVFRMNLFPDAGFWANVGHGNPETDQMLKNLKEMRERVQTVNHTRVDLSKVDVEVYLFERAYHNSIDSYLSIGVVMLDKGVEEAQAYVRPDGNYYNCLVHKGHTIISTEPDDSPTISIENDDERKQVYGLPAFGMGYTFIDGSEMIGGGCPTKGGDVGTYPWGDTGSGYPLNYEEVATLCDAFMIDIKFWANLDGEDSWSDPAMFLGNAGFPYNENTKTTQEYQSQANVYGRFTDPYNVNAGRTSPFELDFTEDGKVRSDDSDSTVAKFTLDFGKLGKYSEFDETTVKLDLSPRGCLVDEMNEGDYAGP